MVKAVVRLGTRQLNCLRKGLLYLFSLTVTSVKTTFVNLNMSPSYLGLARLDELRRVANLLAWLC